MTREPGWTIPPAHPTVESGELAVWLLDADAEQPLERVVARYLGQEAAVVRTDAGRPVVKGAALEVNLAHSGPVALVVVARGGDVGIDIEQLRKDISDWSLPAHALTPAERTRVEAAPDPARAFLELWTQKEALMKAAGLGLAIDPREIEIGANGEILALPHVVGTPGEWTLAPIELDGYAAVAAASGSIARISLYDDRVEADRTKRED